MKKCPICGHGVKSYHEVTFKEPYTHNNPYDGIHIYGAYSAPKETVCYKDNFLHFAFYDANENLVDHRLVQLGVENPTTKSASDEFWESYNDRDQEGFDNNDEWDEVTEDRQLYNDNEDELPF